MILNRLLNIKESNEDKINIFKKDIDKLFRNIIIKRGEDYYKDDKVSDIMKNNNTYTSYVYGTDINDLYEVTIKTDDKGNLIEMNCTCPYEDNCKHEYATILNIQNKY